MEPLNLGNMMDPISTPYDQKAPWQLTGMGPQINPGPSAESVSKWDDFLKKLSSDRNLQTSLVQAGLHMMTPRRPGENAASKIGQGLQIGLGGYQERSNNELAQEALRNRMKNIDANTVGQESQNRVNIETEDEQIAARQEAAQQAQYETDIAAERALQAPMETKVKKVESDNAEAMLDLDMKYKNKQIDALDARIRSSDALADFRSKGGARGGKGSGIGANDQWAARLATVKYDPETQPAQWGEAYTKYSMLMLTQEKEPSGRMIAFEYMKDHPDFNRPPGHPARVKLEKEAEEFGRIWEAEARAKVESNIGAKPNFATQPSTTGGAPLRSAGNQSTPASPAAQAAQTNAPVQAQPAAPAQVVSPDEYEQAIVNLQMTRGFTYDQAKKAVDTKLTEQNIVVQ